MADTKEKVRLIGATVENFMRIKLAELRFDEESGVVRVTGPNHAGKTSLLRAFTAVMKGAGAVPDEPLSKDVPEGARWRGELRLSNGWKIERKQTPSSPKGVLAVTSPDGGKFGQNKLNEWCGPYSFDPLAFFALRPAEKRDVLLSLAKDPKLGEKLAALDDERDDLYKERTPWIVQKQTAGKVPQPPGDRPEPVDISAEMARLSGLRAEQAKLEDARRTATEKGRRVAEWADRIRDLEEQLRRSREQFERAQAEEDRAIDEAEALPDRMVAIEAVERHIADANKVQQDLEPWRRWDEAQAQLGEATERERLLTDVLRKIEADKTRLLEESGIPVPGISFGADGDLRLNGNPLDQASGEEEISLAVDVAMAADPTLRLCLIDEGNELDLDRLKALDAKAKEHDFHVVLVRIGIEGGGDIVVDNGHAYNNEEVRE